ncbi:hypothetical protein LOK49_Contig26G00009 [Camellia lanceoleosa]|nr:hypothetical protein LOK49_Contig26G00009 [Camellia lanceoleosa]
MARAIRDLKYWIEEAAPALLIIFPTKTSRDEAFLPSIQMAKAIRDLKSWIDEAAPALLLISRTKTSNSLPLETIPEEKDSDDCNEDL